MSQLTIYLYIMDLRRQVWSANCKMLKTKCHQKQENGAANAIIPLVYLNETKLQLHPFIDNFSILESGKMRRNITLLNIETHISTIIEKLSIVNEKTGEMNQSKLISFVLSMNADFILLLARLKIYGCIDDEKYANKSYIRTRMNDMIYDENCILVSLEYFGCLLFNILQAFVNFPVKMEWKSWKKKESETNVPK